MNPGDLVVLNVPENPRLHGGFGRIIALTEWGAHVETAAAATGCFRALFSEMLSSSESDDSLVCDTCGDMRWMRTGTCLTCMDCGTSSGGCG